MISLRESLIQIGVQPYDPVSFLGLIEVPPGTPHPWVPGNFVSRPKSLRQAMRAMLSPGGFTFIEGPKLEKDKTWIDECQGVACDGRYWFFTTNSGRHAKRLWVFNVSNGLDDADRVCPPMNFDFMPGLYHIGQVTYHDSYLYVAHDTEQNVASAIVLQFDGSRFRLVRTTQLEQYLTPPYPHVISPATGAAIGHLEFQDMNPWDGFFYSCGDEVGVPMWEFFKHHPETGSLIRRADGTPDTLQLDAPVFCVQGACFSPNGHLYVSENYEYTPGWMRVSYFSALNGHKYGEIGIRAETGAFHIDDEMEGVCYADLHRLSDGCRYQIHVVQLNNAVFDDAVSFLRFCADKPDLV
jgi:hypothetical protein